MNRQRDRYVGASVGIVGALLAASACSAADPVQGEGAAAKVSSTVAAVADPPSAGPDLLLTFDDLVVAPGDVVPELDNEGTAPVGVDVVTSAGGLLTWSWGRGNGTAVRTPVLPDEDGEPGPGGEPAAVIVVRPTGEVDHLSPGSAAITISVDLRLDELPVDTAVDDGDNLLQRGRFGPDPQYKIQLDHGVPSCRMKGDAAEVVVSADDAVEVGRWHRVTCVRAAGAVRLEVTDLEADAAGQERQEWVVDQDPGAIVFTDEALTIGAKLAEDGRLDTSSLDQFRGEIDRAHVDIAE